MPSIRMDKQIFPFFDSVKNPVSAAGTSDSFHNNGFGLITIEVTGTASGRVEGCINIINPDGTTKDDADCVWSTLGLINVENFSAVSSFTGTGHYAVGINGMARVRVVLTSVSGTATIVGVAEA